MSRPLKGNLTDEQIDIFEHAALLYHGYEWQAAADTFDFLSQSIANVKERVHCILNAGMICARLGDYSRAAIYFDEALVLKPKLPIAHFLIALIGIEQREYDTAETCIESCLEGLDLDGIDYTQLGLKFVLNRSSLIRALRDVRTAQYEAHSSNPRNATIVRMDSIPAEYIFEAPPRIVDSLDHIGHSARSHLKLRRPNRLGNSSGSAKSLVRATEQVNGHERSHWQREPGSPPSPMPNHLKGLSETPESTENSSVTSTSVSVSPLASDFKSPALASAVRNKYRTWHRRPSTPFTPRDARGASGSVRELARFIRDEGRSKAIRRFIPKDAKGEYESVEGLTRFVQLHSPPRSNSGILKPLDVDAKFISDLRMLKIMDRKNEREIGISDVGASSSEEIESDAQLPTTTSDSHSGNASSNADAADIERHGTRPLTRRLMAHPILDTPSPTSPSEDDMLAMEILQPVVYQPPARKVRKERNASEAALSSFRHAENEMTPVTTASSASSLYRGSTSFDRRLKARQNTLKALEGKASDEVSRAYTSTRTSSTITIDCKTASSIDTVDFFSKVLEREKKTRT